MCVYLFIVPNFLFIYIVESRVKSNKNLLRINLLVLFYFLEVRTKQQQANRKDKIQMKFNKFIIMNL
jgi:hypothetical protein